MRVLILKQIKYLLEAFLIYSFYFFFKAFQIETSSVIGGKLLKFCSCVLKENKIMEKNLKNCFPNTTYSYRKKIILSTWEHFGSVIGELSHWHNMGKREFFDRIKIINPHNMPRSRALIISGHIGNWELISKIAREYSINLTLVYRPSNNPYTDNLINKLRNSYNIPLIPKGAKGVKKILQELKNGRVVGMMIDQKMDEGISVPFFKKDAMTTTLPATLALKYKVPIIMSRIIKTGNAKYTAEFCEHLKITSTDTKFSIMKKINSILEKWIIETPEQWFWFHNRWK